MKSRILSRATFFLTLAPLLFFSATAWAQYNDNRPSPGAMLAGGFFLLLFLIIGLAIYVYVSLALQTIAKRTNTPDGWLAWIPIVNIILMLNIAKKPVWWIILFFVPLVNLIMSVIVWMAIAEARGKPNWWGILMIIPPVSLIVPGYLAWSA